MKRVLILILLSFLFMLSSCSKKMNADNTNPESVFEYEATKGENLCFISVDNDTLYTVKYDERGNAVIESFDKNGQIMNQIFTDIQVYDLSCFAVANNRFYFAVEDTIICMNQNGDAVCEYHSDDILQYGKIKIRNEKLYFLGFGNDDMNAEHFTSESGIQINYESNGKLVGRYDISTGEKSDIDIDNPAAFSTNRNGAVIYAFDSEGGYYFCEERTPDKKMYITNAEDYAYLQTFEMIDDDRFVYGDAGHFFISSIKEESGSVVLSQNVMIFNSKEICTSGTDAYIIRTIDGGPSRIVERFECSFLEISDKPIRAIYCEYTADLPRTIGDEVLYVRLSQEEFALKVLSLDHDFDAAIIKSNEGVADSVKKLGAFYPLNELKSVAEYSEKCFPNIKKAITEANGEIKLLPISFDVPAIIYNKENCNKNGIVLNSDWQDYLSMLESKAAYSDNFMSLEYNIRDNIFLQQIQNRGKLYSNEFFELADALKNMHNSDCLKGNFQLHNDLINEMTMPGGEYRKKASKSFLFSFETQLFSQSGFIGNTIGVTARPIPVSEGGAYGGTCTFLCINPYSDRIQSALKYAENTAEYLSEQYNSFLLANEDRYSEDSYTRSLYKVYSNADVIINIPSEIYWDDFDRYLDGDISIEEYAEEADRKLKVYLNE